MENVLTHLFDHRLYSLQCGARVVDYKKGLLREKRGLATLHQTQHSADLEGVGGQLGTACINAALGKLIGPMRALYQNATITEIPHYPFHKRKVVFTTEI